MPGGNFLIQIMAVGKEVLNLLVPLSQHFWSVPCKVSSAISSHSPSCQERALVDLNATK